MQKIQPAKPINFVSHRKIDEECVIDSKSDIIEIMINDKTEEVIEELVKSLLSRYQIELKTKMKDSSFIFDYAHLMYYKYHKINLNHGRSYIDPPD